MCHDFINASFAAVSHDCNRNVSITTRKEELTFSWENVVILEGSMLFEASNFAFLSFKFFLLQQHLRKKHKLIVISPMNIKSELTFAR